MTNQTPSQWIDTHADELIAALARLVRIPSVVGHEQDAQAFMREAYAELGLELDVFEPNREELLKIPAFVDSGFDFATRQNVVGTWRGRGGGAATSGKSIILNGHTDVVSAEPVSAWKHEPYGAEIVPSPNGAGRGRMYGRGAQDMKSGVIANLFAVKALMACGVALRGDVILESVIEEEAGGGGGTLACFARGHIADGMIATEPHWFDLTFAHPGILYFRVVVDGKSAHAGRAHQGVNAAVELAPIISMFGEWDKERAEKLHYEPFERLDPAARRSCHLNVGVVRAGDWPSTVPGRAECEVRMSFIPGESEAGVKQEIARRVADVAQKSAWLQTHPPRIEYFGWHTDPWIQDENHEFVQAFLRVAKTQPSLPTIQPMGITAGLDTRFAGVYGVPAFAWGPLGAGLHGADEWVDLDSVLACAKMLAQFVQEWCK